MNLANEITITLMNLSVKLIKLFKGSQLNLNQILSRPLTPTQPQNPPRARTHS